MFCPKVVKDVMYTLIRCVMKDVGYNPILIFATIAEYIFCGLFITFSTIYKEKEVRYFS